jgi:hypothetical protein
MTVATSRARNGCGEQYRRLRENVDRFLHSFLRSAASDFDDGEMEDEDEATVAVCVRPWLLWQRRGSKRLRVGGRRVDLAWDPSRARFPPSGSPEPSSGYFVAVDGEMAVVAGDMAEEAYRRTKARRAPAPPSSRGGSTCPCAAPAGAGTGPASPCAARSGRSRWISCRAARGRRRRGTGPTSACPSPSTATACSTCAGCAGSFAAARRWTSAAATGSWSPGTSTTGSSPSRDASPPPSPRRADPAGSRHVRLPLRARRR